MGYGSFEGNESQGTGRTSSQSTQNVWAAQAPYLEQLYGQGATLAGAPAVGFDPHTASAWQSALSGQINPATGQVISNATQQLGLDFSRNVMPALRSSAISSGATGGDREGIAEGLAAGDVARQAQTMGTNLWSSAMDQANQARTAALGMSPALMQLQASLPWSNLNQFAQILGSPTVLGTSSSAGSTDQQSKGMKMAGGGA